MGSYIRHSRKFPRCTFRFTDWKWFREIPKWTQSISSFFLLPFLARHHCCSAAKHLAIIDLWPNWITDWRRGPTTVWNWFTLLICAVKYNRISDADLDSKTKIGQNCPFRCGLYPFRTSKGLMFAFKYSSKDPKDQVVVWVLCWASSIVLVDNRMIR